MMVSATRVRAWWPLLTPAPKRKPAPRLSSTARPKAGLGRGPGNGSSGAEPQESHLRLSSSISGPGPRSPTPRRHSLAGDHGFQLVDRLPDGLRQVCLSGISGPAFERDLEGSDPGPGSQGRTWLGDAALAQRAGHRRGECGKLHQLALLQLHVRSDDGLALPGEVTALLEQGAGRLKGRAYRGDRRGGLWGVGQSADQEVLQFASAREQHLALVGEVAEESPLGQSRPGRDLRYRGLVETALDIELERCPLESAARVRLPATHAPTLLDDSG